VIDKDRRPLEKLPVILYPDALVVKVKQDSRIANRSIYLAVWVNPQWYKEALGFWAAENICRLALNTGYSRYHLQGFKELLNTFLALF
jgi:putative transposase